MPTSRAWTSGRGRRKEVMASDPGLFVQGLTNAVSSSSSSASMVLAASMKRSNCGPSFPVIPGPTKVKLWLIIARRHYNEARVT